MPVLVDAPQTKAASSAPAGAPRQRTLPGPGEPGFDPWCLTDSATRETWKRDQKARATIATLWEYDPDPKRTLATQAEIDAALARGDVAYATNRSGQRIGYYYCCP